MIEVPAVVRKKAVACGAMAWLDALDDLVRSVAEAWDLRLGAAFGDATEAVVLAASRADGMPAVLKLLVPRHGGAARHEAVSLQLASGDGLVRLLEADIERGALLLERLGPSMHDCDLPIDERLAILTGLARRVWRPALGCGLPTGASKAAALAEQIVESWEELDRPCSEAAVEDAVQCAERRAAAHDDERAVLVHGDVHQWNALRSGDGWALVDPDGILAEPAADLGVLMREDPTELLAGDPWGRAHLLGGWCGVDPVAVWEWGVIERVSTGLLCTEIGLQPVGREMLWAADALAELAR